MTTSSSSGKGGYFGLVEHGQRIGDEFDLSGGQRGVFLARQSRGDLAGDGDHVFGAQRMGLRGNGGVFLRPEDHLRDARAVTQVDEDDPAVVPARIDPAGERGGGAHVGGAELVAGMGAVAAHKRSGVFRGRQCEPLRAGSHLGIFPAPTGRLERAVRPFEITRIESRGASPQIG